MMRYAFVIAAIVLAACTFPPVNEPKQQEVPISPTIEITAPREVPEAPKAKEPKPQTQKAVHPCSGIETGDAKSDVKAKLECLEEHG